ncbi:hypothetical protein EJ110_NYTH20972 [Nymphaea thermarum]|nr:hypothetical protein EJ110_NYTH20972 [Nymphaea thermarum]
MQVPPQLPPGFRFHPTDEELVVHSVAIMARSTSTSLTLGSSLGEAQRTRELPRVKLVEVDLADDGNGKRSRGGLSLEVVDDELLIHRVEPEARRKQWLLGRHLHGELLIHRLEPKLLGSGLRSAKPGGPSPGVGRVVTVVSEQFQHSDLGSHTRERVCLKGGGFQKCNYTTLTTTVAATQAISTTITATYTTAVTTTVAATQTSSETLVEPLLVFDWSPISSPFGSVKSLITQQLARVSTGMKHEKVEHKEEEEAIFS